ncbi:imelysin family protein [Pikeienuella sp. HZG-20]|uniref:imelysin family protein n=1 Tax=Paludibacillus litoralis TaxID=3133267 RepID=UPI0030EF2EB9
MRWLFVALLSLLAAAPASADPDYAALTERAVEGHAVPGYQRLVAATGALTEAAATCAPDRTEAAYNAAFDAWMGVSHLRFGPAEAEARAFSLAFWPDTKGFTPKTLRRLIAAEDPLVDDPAGFSKLSVAGKGLFALDFLLFDPEISTMGSAAYRCRLAVAVARDMQAISTAILDGWTGRRAALMESAGAPDNVVYLSASEPAQMFFTAMLEGLQATLDLRLERPLGTVERPRPKRAEAWRSGRPLRNVRLSLAALSALYESAFAPELSAAENEMLRAAFADAEQKAASAPAPLTEAVSSPEGWGRIDALRASVAALRNAVSGTVGPALGLLAGFNSLDGD